MPSIFQRLFKREARSSTSAAPAPARGRFDAFCDQGTAMAAAQEFERAIQLYDHAIASDPSRPEGHYQRANALRNLGRLEAAVAGYDQAIARKADYAYAFCNRGVAEHRLGLMSAALASFDRAIALDAADAMAHYNRALLMQDCSRWDEALASYDRALAIDPQFADAQYNRAMTQLFLGDFESGWRGYEWRWVNARRLGIGEARTFSQPRWTGQESIAGKRLLLYAEAGLGDTLQFCRYAIECARREAVVLLEVQPPLAGLLKSLDGVSQLIAAGGSLPPFDYHCPLLSLPLAFGTTLDAIPAPVRYLHADAAKIAAWRERLGERRRARVGLVWSGNPKNAMDARRSIRLVDWIGRLPPELEYYRLQTQVREADRAALEGHAAIVSFDDDLLDFENTAALCQCLDLVITVDTSLAHLAGALGHRTWVLLPHTPDFRWLRDRSDSPWYPSMTLYRQRAAGDWTGVLEQVAADLRRAF